MIRLLGDRILVKRLEADEEIRGGIVIPDTAKEKPQEGEVVAVGPGKVENGTKVEMTVAKGDRILFSKYSGSEVKLQGEVYLVTREEEVIGILEG